ncbi:MAG: UDP-glucose 4-epimerase, partial [uncultured Solirubrobacteraceae bacterium]
ASHRHRRRRIHRIEPRRRAARRRPSGDGHRRPLQRARGEPARRHGARSDAGARRRLRSGGDAGDLPRLRARGRLPPGGPDRRPQVGGRPGLRRTHQRGRHRLGARGRAAHRSAPRGVRLHRGSALRRDGRHPHARGQRDRTDGAVRHQQVRRRGLPRPLPPALRPLHARPALRQRLRAAPGSARRGRRHRHLLRHRAGGRPRGRLRRRAPDARLRLRRRRRAGLPAGRGVRRHRGAERRHVAGDDGARDRRGAGARGRLQAGPARRGEPLLPRRHARRAGAGIPRAGAAARGTPAHDGGGARRRPRDL